LGKEKLTEMIRFKKCFPNHGFEISPLVQTAAIQALCNLFFTPIFIPCCENWLNGQFLMLSGDWELKETLLNPHPSQTGIEK